MIDAQGKLIGVGGHLRRGGIGASAECSCCVVGLGIARQHRRDARIDGHRQRVGNRLLRVVWIWIVDRVAGIRHPRIRGKADPTLVAGAPRSSMEGTGITCVVPSTCRKPWYCVK